MKYIQLNASKREIRLGLLCIMVCMVFFGCGSSSVSYFEEESSSNKVIDSEEKNLEDETQMQEKVEVTDTIFVFVCGCVQSPGVYELQMNARIFDAIDAAGGMTEQACTEYWNLAQCLEDGQKIYVPSRDEIHQESVAKLSSIDVENVSGVEETDGKVNINTASKEQLMQLPGVGESRAEGIITYRTEHGNFSSIEEIKNVSGIGDAIFSRMKDKITV